MSKICTLFSGSSGNCTYIENKGDAILVDAGVSAKRITQALNDRNLDIGKIKAVFVTHEHSDHVSGVRVFCTKNQIPVYSTNGTYKGMENEGFINEKVDCRILEDETDMGSIGVKYFHTCHDTLESCGYTFDLGDKKIAVCTDLGTVTDEVHNAISGCQTVVLESNHDIKMLQNNPSYPFYLKRRILSENGHLSNNSCAEEVEKLIESGTTRFILAHLSRENNLPMLAHETTRSLLLMDSYKETKDYLLSVASPQDNEVIII
ncbi:MAG: MBL fold metallo-hydrolase [Acutalibacteraceae bacterium]|nr:MBL fold metallo-hydrolase [Acutalibacteraceae bacterium]